MIIDSTAQMHCGNKGFSAGQLTPFFSVKAGGKRVKNDSDRDAGRP
jgi:hypothetical protein